MTTIHFAVTLCVFAVLLLWVAWRERRNDNTADAMLLAFFGVASGLGAGAALLLLR